jgi:hypothetical protein
MKVFHCDHCGQLLFFENSVCMRCGRSLAYAPERGQLRAFLRGGPAEGGGVRLCANYVAYEVCNWALDSGDEGPLCRACRLTKTIPNLSQPGNDRRWYKLEVAKRRLVYTLLQLGLPLTDQIDDPAHGLAFEFLEDVLTGHASGIITVNIVEADDAERVRRRVELGEPYRTLLGHFRHESGHYYWDRIVAGTDRLVPFRALFGDERADYDSALKRNYGEGAPADWQARHVSAYAAMHPWEDWAETWAHYLHIVDTLETAAACGISIDPPRSDEPTLLDVPNPVASAPIAFDALMQSWLPITYVLNNLNRGLGVEDAYPFVLSSAVVEKLRFVHETIRTSRSRS